MDSETNHALDIAKDFLDFLFIAKMVVVYDGFPSVDLEYLDNQYKISLSYLDYRSFVFDTPQALFLFLKRLSLKKTISRIHITNGTTLAVVYGNLYSHELMYSDQFKIVRFKENNFENLNNYILI